MTRSLLKRIGTGIVYLGIGFEFVALSEFWDAAITQSLTFYTAAIITAVVGCLAVFLGHVVRSFSGEAPQSSFSD